MRREKNIMTQTMWTGGRSNKLWNGEKREEIWWRLIVGSFHNSTQPTFIEHLLGARHCTRHWTFKLTR